MTVDYDIAILGGGMCGLGAALASAAQGHKALLVERRQALGWEATSALRVRFERSDSPVAERVRRRLNAIRGLRGERVDAPFLEFLLDQMLDEAGIELLLYSQPTRLAADGDRVTGVWIGNKSGEQLLRARAYVDATESALLWRQTGARWTVRKTCPAVASVFFNLAEPGLDLPLPLGELPAPLHGSMTAYPSVREHEVCVEYMLADCDITEMRLALDDVIAAARTRLPALGRALVTHASLEPYPLDAPAVLAQRVPQGGRGACRHPDLRNLFAAGIWALPDAAEQRAANTLSGRLGLGERAALEAAAALDALSEPPHPALDGDAREPVSREADVIVVGGGTAGALAAIAAGRQGARVILLEMSTLLGGMVTGGGVPWGGHGVRGGLQDEYQARVARRRELYAGVYHCPPMHPEAAKVALDEMCHEAGVEVIYGATGVGVEMAGRRVRGVIAATPRGTVVYRGQAIVDSSGDADVARMAGAPTAIGRETDGVIHCYSQCGMVLFPGGRMSATNHDCGYVDSFDVVDLTRARREGIRQMHARWRRGLLGERRLLYHCPLIGLRQGARIVGEYAKTMLEQIAPVHYEDTIGYASAKYDCHSQDFENQQDLPVLWVWMLGNRERGIGGEIPYRCLLPKGVEGLLVACRSASTTNEAAYQFRVIRNMYRIGEAAGIAAALCSELNTTPRDVDLGLVQGELSRSGALGEDVHPGPVVPERPLEELAAMLASEDPKDAVWLLAQGGEPERALLKESLGSASPGARFWAAVALAWHKDPDAVPELVEAVVERVAERPDYTPRHRNMVPLWQSCIVMLGRIGDARALPVLLAVLTDRSVDLDALIAAVRALGRIGDGQQAVPALRALLARDDLPRERRFQQTNVQGRWPAGEDGLWQVELAAAEVLARFGCPQPDVVERYLADPRTHVRRYARQVADK